MKSTRHHRTGITFIYTAFMLCILSGFASLAVDWGRVQMVKTQLMRASESAARYGAVGLENGADAAIANALAAAADNGADGSAVVLDPNRDIEIGNWDTVTRAFTPVTGAARNLAGAIRVTARRTAASGQAVSLIFGKSVGQTTCDVTAVTVACINRGSVAAMSVPATSNPWLSGSPAGTVANPVNPHNNPDYAGDINHPGQSPIQAGSVHVTPGARMTFDSITGGANNFFTTQMYTPDGNTGWITDNLAGAENGKSDCYAPINAVIGVYLGSGDPAQSGSIPPTLDFSTQSSRNFQSLSPQMGQVFFIGDGRRDNGAVQQFVVPAGATRLFIGTMDQYEWNNNVGSYTVTAHNVGTVRLVK